MGGWAVITIQLVDRVAHKLEWAGRACSQLTTHRLGNVQRTAILTSSRDAGRSARLFQSPPRTIMTTSNNVTGVSWGKFKQRG